MSFNPLVSIVMTTHNRAALLRNTLESIDRQDFKDYEIVIVDDGTDNATPELCQAYKRAMPITYARLDRVKTVGYGNPAYPNNVGIRLAQAPVVILQNAECQHANDSVIVDLLSHTGSNNAVFAQVAALPEHKGEASQWYCHPQHSRRPFFFCGALRKSWFEKLRGFDEDYQYYGMDDVDFADRLTIEGVQFDFTGIPVEHQWHKSSFDPSDPNNNLPGITYARKTMEMRAGTITTVRNLNKEWGAM